MEDKGYQLIRSGRRSISLAVTRDGEVVVRAPLHMPAREIERFIASHEGWVQKAVLRQSLHREKYPEPDAAEALALKKAAAEHIPQRVEYYSKLMGLRPKYVKITSAKQRFGSCGPEGGLCFSWRLMRYPAAAIDYVVVHELAHILHRNHGAAFYGCIEAYLPDYKARMALLRE